MTPEQIWLWNCIAYDLRYQAADRRLARLGRRVLMLVAQYGGREAARELRESSRPAPRPRR